MARPVYPYELDDQDYYWLITHFEETHPDYVMYSEGAEPVVFIKVTESHNADIIHSEEIDCSYPESAKK